MWFFCTIFPTRIVILEIIIIDIFLVPPIYKSYYLCTHTLCAGVKTTTIVKFLHTENPNALNVTW